VPVTQVDESDEEDENKMFGGGVKLPSLKKEESLTKPDDKLEIKDTLIVFVKDELVMFRFNRMTGWNVGDSNFEFPRFSSFVRIPDRMSSLNKVDGFVTGGSLIGFGQRVAFGIKFVRKVTNAVETIDCEQNLDSFLPEMEVGRSMHQSCIIQNK